MCRKQLQCGKVVNSKLFSLILYCFPYRETRIGVIICKVHIYSEAVFPSDAAYIREADGEAGLHQLASGTLSKSGMGPSFV